MAKRRLRLRSYQLDAVRAVASAWKRALCVAACGTGKTLMAAHAAGRLLDGHPGAALVVFPTPLHPRTNPVRHRGLTSRSGADRDTAFDRPRFSRTRDR
ncbi:hypothetical protein FEG63_30945 [Mycolicibacterium sphagni]|uniref:Helicase/UvrB N-terminal domain-containing protein n=1 Tax=Mycolicibacterium sphagni TaxID=1786 RepID=A0ABX2K1S8_9MYCO|nr:hypothetical protein [Mycolicibacterium sphagni]